MESNQSSWNPAFMPDTADAAQQFNEDSIPKHAKADNRDNSSSDDVHEHETGQEQGQEIYPSHQTESQAQTARTSHHSTSSFARTAHGIDWDEDNNGDGEWDVDTANHSQSHVNDIVRHQDEEEQPHENVDETINTSNHQQHNIPEHTGEEADEVDINWTSSTNHDDAFDFLTPSNRSNSFPVVPPLDIVPDTHAQLDHPLPHSQASEIVAEVEEEDNQLLTATDIIQGEHNSHHFQHDSFDNQSEANFFTNPTSTDYGNSYGAEASQSDFADRYDEGIPLVPHAQDENQESLDDTNPNEKAPIEVNDDDVENSFTPVGHGPALNRKSTMQVIDNLHFEPQNNDDGDSDEDEVEDPEEFKPSRRPSMGGDVAASKDTVLQQVLSNITPGSKLDIVDEGQSSDDIAAQWAAALADDEFLDDDDFLPDDDEEPQPSALNPATFFGDDTTGDFLDNNDTQLGHGQASIRQTASPAPIAAVTDGNGQMLGFDTLSNSAQANVAKPQNRYVPAGVSTTSVAPAPTNAYRPAAPLFTNLTQSQPGQPQSQQQPQPGPFNAAPQNLFGAQPQAIKPDLNKATSFAAQGKGGYHSPYDLPMDVVVPKKRQNMQQMTNNYTPGLPPQIAAPPRSSSMNQNMAPPRATTRSVGPSIPSQIPSQIAAPTQPKAIASQPSAPPLKSSSSFFEDLPATTIKPRASGRYTPQPNSANQNVAPANLPPQGFAPPPPPQFQPQPQNGPQVPLQQSLQPSPFANSPTQMQHGLVAPPPTNPYANLNNVPQAQQPPVASRYSPAPLPVQNNMPPPVASGKFAAAPTLRQSTSFYAAPPQAAHQPRTSSPLAQFERSTDNRQNFGPPVAQGNNAGMYRRGSYNDQRSTLTSTPEGAEPPSTNTRSVSQQNRASAAPPSMTPLSPSKRAISNYQNTRNGPERSFAPPQRSQTQSPGRMRANAPVAASSVEPVPRPSSVHDPSSPRQSSSTFAPLAPIVPQKTRARGMSTNFNYLEPTDGREHDPLQRWKGAPVFAWGLGGTIVTTFPKHVPRYGIQTTPVIVCNPGEVKLHNLKNLCPIEPRLANFPGPLRGKSKKKELLAWLKAGIEMLDQANADLRLLPTLTHGDKRREERVLLWRILSVLVEHDGILEGNDSVNKAVRDAISPGNGQEGQAVVPNYSTGADLSGIYRKDGALAQAEPVDPTAVDELRKYLLHGEREKAVWLAVDKRLWAHAMLISNTVSPDLYRQVAQEFVQKEVRNIGENTEPLAALYAVFAGNFEESVDELVPASARAGFQMVSSSGPTGPQKDATDKLDRWRETLGLYLSNRSPNDGQAIAALGRLLAGYGRAEAAHTCFLFARNHMVFGGADDPNVNMVLVGFEHLRIPPDNDSDLESILLSEVYEYAMSGLASVPTMPAGAPHLASYKLHHATVLAGSGQRDKALQYCEMMATTLTSQTRRSPYYHTLLVSSLDDLNKRLKSSPKDGSSSWISKPSIDKVSNSVWSKFNDFVTGGEKDEDTAQPGETAPEIGPFARIAGGTPVLSREPSSADLGAYSSYTGGSLGGPQPIPPSLGRTASRYAPSGSYNPATSDSASASPYTSQQSSYTAPTQIDQHMYASAAQQASQNRYAPSANDRYAPGAPQPATPYTPSYPATPTVDTAPAFGMYNSPQSINSGQSVRGSLDSLRRPAPAQQKSYNFPPQQPYQPVDVPNLNRSHESESLLNPDSEDAQPSMDSLTSGQGDEPSYGYEAHGGYRPVPVSEERTNTEESTNEHAPVEKAQAYQPYQPGSNFADSANNNGFQPIQQDTGFVPYENSAPYQPQDDEPDSPVTTKPKRGPMYDDDDDDIPALRQPSASSQPPREKTKAEKDREADEAFRRAAEEDDKKAAAAAAAAPVKKGWGWNPFGGGSKKESMDTKADANAPNKPIKAKLGEESSFVYDTELKRWVNKKAGAEDTAAKAATPPPPRAAGPPRTASGSSMPSMNTSAPPSRHVSGVMPPPSTTGSRQVSATLPASTEVSTPPASAGLPPKMPPRMDSNASLGGSSAPPSRPGTVTPGAASKKADPMDELLGLGTTTRKAGAKKGKKARGFVDVMADKIGDTKST